MVKVRQPDRIAGSVQMVEVHPPYRIVAFLVVKVHPPYRIATTPW